LTLKDLKVEHPDKPSLAVRPGYYEYGDDGTFRRVGKRVSTEYGTGNDVQVRVWVSDHNRPLKVNKAYLLAIAATGWLGSWQCPDCDERIPHIVQHPQRPRKRPRSGVPNAAWLNAIARAACSTPD
jgi:hypothetical protein